MHSSAPGRRPCIRGIACQARGDAPPHRAAAPHPAGGSSAQSEESTASSVSQANECGRNNPQRSFSVHQLRENQSRLLPVASHCTFGNVQGLSNFLFAVTTKVAHLRHL